MTTQTVEKKPWGRVQALAGAMALVGGMQGVHAADVQVIPPSGAGFSVMDNSGAQTRLRVLESGTVSIPGLPTAPSQSASNATCFDAGSGQLGPCAASQPVYLTLRESSTSSVPAASSVTFWGVGNLSGNIDHTTGTDSTTINVAGTYRIFFTLHYTAGAGTSVGVSIDNAVDSVAQAPLLAPAGTVTGETIRTLAAGAVVSLKNFGSQTLTLATSPNVGATMTFIKLY